MKASISGDGHELCVELNIADLPFAASAKSLKTKLPESAGDISAGVLEMLTSPPEPGEPRPIRIVRVRLVRTEIVGESIIELPTARQVYA